MFFFFFQAEDGIRDLTVTGVQTCALPIFKWRAIEGTPAPTISERSCAGDRSRAAVDGCTAAQCVCARADQRFALPAQDVDRDRKSTRLNSSHSQISYAVFCLKKKMIPRAV